MSVQPTRHNFKIWKGATFQYKLTYFEGGEGSNPQDLTGYIGDMVLKDSKTKATLTTLTTENGGILISGPTGEIEITIPADDVDAFTWKQAVYELAIEKDGIRDILLYGTVSITSLLV